MNFSLRTLSYAAVLLPFSFLSQHALAQQQWIAPTPAELSMTSVPDVPGAPAVYLFREEITDDSLRMFSFYVRMKVLNERGKDYANVELPFYAGEAGNRIDAIAGRTIHPDGSITPFSGKPYEKLIEKSGRNAYKTKVFTLPAVEVGSILEYRYKIHYDDAYFIHPDWYIQNELYLTKGHFLWKPTSHELITNDERGQVTNAIAWTPILPANATVKNAMQMGGSHGSMDSSHREIELSIEDVPPVPTGEYLPPMRGLSYRVLFYYTSYRSSDEYWKSEGKHWSTVVDKFAHAGKGVDEQTKSLVAGATSQTQKLKNIYAFVMTLENTDFTRSHTRAEDKAQGLKAATTVEDVLARKRGAGDDLAALFVSMARAAGMQAYLMGVTNRGERLFLKDYLSTRQLDDLIAIVNVDGKEGFYDPGQRYCTFGHIAWQHTLSGGLRQADSGVKLVSTAHENYTTERVTRIGDLTLDDQGVAEGTVKYTFTGDDALDWRHRALTADEESVKNDLRKMMESELPGGMEVKLISIDALTDGEKPLTVNFTVKGPVATSTGKRLLVPANLFAANNKPMFVEAARKEPVVMQHAVQVQDAVRFKYPSTLTLESAPTAEKAMIEGSANFSTSTKPGQGSLTLFHNISQDQLIYAPAEYQKLHDFYTKVSSHNGDTVIFTRSPGGASAKPSGATD